MNELQQRLTRVTDAAGVRFGDFLREMCDDRHASMRTRNDPEMIWKADSSVLPIDVAAIFALILEVLVHDALAHGFEARRGGRICISSFSDAETWQLVIEDSGTVLLTSAKAWPHVMALSEAERLVLRLRGRLDIPVVIGGNRYVAVVPRR